MKTNSTTNVDKTIASLNKQFKDAGLDSQAFNWKHAGATFASSVEGISALFTALVVILAIVVFIIIMNTLTVSVIERTGEIGTMRALGASKGFVRKLFFTESISITLLSAIGGTLIALLIMVVFNAFHLSVDGDIAKMILGGGSIQFIPTLKNILGTILLVCVGSSLANIYPVSAALKISPLKALSQDGE
jgi:putative ABC transport system permease protein